jgi:hypothetical protein
MVELTPGLQQLANGQFYRMGSVEMECRGSLNSIYSCVCMGPREEGKCTDEYILDSPPVPHTLYIRDSFIAYNMGLL